MIPGIIIAFLTFPGVILHELAHQFFCRIMRVPVYEVKYFQFANPCGYVMHEETRSPGKTFFISVGPFIINTIIGALLLVPCVIELYEFEVFNNPLYIILGWLGFSILMHAFPSKGDAKNIVEVVLKSPNVNIFIKIICAPVVGLIYICSIGSVFWLDALYAIGISALIISIL